MGGGKERCANQAGTSILCSLFLLFVCTYATSHLVIYAKADINAVIKIIKASDGGRGLIYVIVKSENCKIETENHPPDLISFFCFVVVVVVVFLFFSFLSYLYLSLYFFSFVFYLKKGKFKVKKCWLLLYRPTTVYRQWFSGIRRTQG